MSIEDVLRAVPGYREAHHRHLAKVPFYGSQTALASCLPSRGRG